MKKRITMIIALTLCVSVLSGCGGCDYHSTSTTTNIETYTDADGNTVTTTTTTSKENGKVTTSETVTEEIPAEPTVDYAIGLLNGTDLSITEARVQSQGKEISDNYLSEPMAPGKGMFDIILLTIPESQHNATLSYVFEDGSEVTAEDFDLAPMGTKGSSTITPFVYYNDEGEAEVGYYYSTDITVVNNTDLDFVEFRCSSSLDDNWSENLIGTPLAAGESFSSSFVYESNNVLWDFQTIDGDGDVLQFEEIDMSGTAEPDKLTVIFSNGDEEGTYSIEVQ